MMSFLEKLQERYTTKKYDPTKKIERNKINELKEILRLSPSSINSQPWQFTFVTDPAIKIELAKASLFNDKKVLDCDTVIVFSRINNIASFEKQIREELPESVFAYYNQHIKSLPENEIKSWFDKQVYLSLGVLLSACAVMEIDATPMEGIEADNYDAILGLKEYHAIVAVTIGYRDQEDANQISIKPKSRVALDKIVKTIK